MDHKKKKKNVKFSIFQLYFKVLEYLLLIKIYKCTNENFITGDRTSHLENSLTNLG